MTGSKHRSRTSRRTHHATAIALALGLVACGPLVMIPGGALSGTESAAPSDWSFSDEIDTVQLETNPEDPYSVNVWGVAAGGAFYIAAGDKNSTWAEHIAKDPRVRLKLGDAVYAMTATRTENESDLEAFIAAARAKYDFQPDADQRAKAALFRLSPR